MIGEHKIRTGRNGIGCRRGKTGRRSEEGVMSDFERVAREWLIARDIIVIALEEISPEGTIERHQRNAAAILARLASHKPPILLQFDEEESCK